MDRGRTVASERRDPESGRELGAGHDEEIEQGPAGRLRPPPLTAAPLRCRPGLPGATPVVDAPVPDHADPLGSEGALERGEPVDRSDADDDESGSSLDTVFGTVAVPHDAP